MDAYTSFAQVYDMFMDNVPYEEWCDYLCRILKKEQIEQETVLELGCGTGRMTRLMAERGYDMIGVDNSPDMLDVARQGSGEADILYLLQDMRELDLYGSVRAVYSVCDCMNYITEPKELLLVFTLVQKYLEPGGVFIFDMNTSYKYYELLGENTFAENREDGSFIWENYFDEASQINEYDLTLFIREASGMFRRFEELHYQRCYETDEVCALLEKAGMELVGVYDAYTDRSPQEDSDRVTFIVKKRPD